MKINFKLNRSNLWIPLLSALLLVVGCASGNYYDRNCAEDQHCRNNGSSYNRNLQNYNYNNYYYQQQHRYNQGGGGSHHNPFHVPAGRFHNAGNPGKWKL
ncbi:hypothetical protein [Leptospira sp. 'Mane']|uniref:hypothetical protein n=1 Tax=Leptospira sp. 'Mane' TaxID=3387407 RepID=UPI00398A6248